MVLSLINSKCLCQGCRRKGLVHPKKVHKSILGWTTKPTQIIAPQVLVHHPESVKKLEGTRLEDKKASRYHCSFNMQQLLNSL